MTLFPLIHDIINVYIFTCTHLTYNILHTYLLIILVTNLSNFLDLIMNAYTRTINIIKQALGDVDKVLKCINLYIQYIDKHVNIHATHT